jgi:hypothetical protein
MCLIITAELQGIDPERLPALAETWPKERLPFAVRSGGWLRPRPVKLALDGCDLLADDADWNAETWAMEPDSLEQLADAFAWLFDQHTGDVVVEALWLGDRPETACVLTPAEFLDIVRRGAIGTKTRYVVRR